MLDKARLRPGDTARRVLRLGDPVSASLGYWGSNIARGGFLAEVLGIRLKAEVLPLSSLAGYLPPFWLSPQLAMRQA